MKYIVIFLFNFSLLFSSEIIEKELKYTCEYKGTLNKKIISSDKHLKKAKKKALSKCLKTHLYHKCIFKGCVQK
jgi:hypothetical protein